MKEPGTGQPAAQPATKGPKKLKPEDFEGYGSEMRDLVDGFNALLEENAQLKGTVTKTQEDEATRAFNSFVTTLKGKVPDYDTVNYSEAFHAWLAGVALETLGQDRQSFKHSLARSTSMKRWRSSTASKPILPVVIRVRLSLRLLAQKEDIVQPTPSAAGAESGLSATK